LKEVVSDWNIFSQKWCKNAAAKKVFGKNSFYHFSNKV